jgi:hypothetical protein
MASAVRRLRTHGTGWCQVARKKTPTGNRTGRSSPKNASPKKRLVVPMASRWQPVRAHSPRTVPADRPPKQCLDRQFHASPGGDHLL